MQKGQAELAAKNAELAREVEQHKVEKSGLAREIETLKQEKFFLELEKGDVEMCEPTACV